MVNDESVRTNLRVPGHWDIPYDYSAGAVATEFFERLKEDQQILGSRCAQCERRFVPPRAFCEICFVPMDDLEPVGPGGVLQAFTIVQAAFAGMPKPPYVVAYVQLDGASTSVVNFLTGQDLSDVAAAGAALEIGSRVRTVFSANEGKMTDFHFELESPTGS